MKKVTTVRDYNPRHNGRLLEISETIKPDLFWFDKREKIAPESIEQFKSMFSRVIFIK